MTRKKTAHKIETARERTGQSISSPETHNNSRAELLTYFIKLKKPESTGMSDVIEGLKKEGLVKLAFLAVAAGVEREIDDTSFEAHVRTCDAVKDLKTVLVLDMVKEGKRKDDEGTNRIAEVQAESAERNILLYALRHDWNLG
ncbi:MAG TPA: hypothetical protein PKX38_03640 [Alphaproteobacteria bacterium]|nr:hypothetical protein [Micavibrio sp.]HQX27013.1 hypothetical protein [Alphaproteobacteria bacterium]